MPVIEQTHITTMTPSGADSRHRGGLAEHFLCPGFEPPRPPHKKKSLDKLAHVHRRAVSQAVREEMPTDDPQK